MGQMIHLQFEALGSIPTHTEFLPDFQAIKVRMQLTQNALVMLFHISWYNGGVNWAVV